MSTLSTDEVRAIDRMPKWKLAQEVEAWVTSRGRTWLIGDPREWSKDELVSAVVRIRTGGQP